MAFRSFCESYARPVIRGKNLIFFLKINFITLIDKPEYMIGLIVYGNTKPIFK